MQRNDQNQGYTPLNVAKTIKKFALPTALSIGRVAAPVFNNVYFARENIKEFFGADEEFLELPSVITVTAITAFMIIATRIVVIYLETASNDGTSNHRDATRPKLSCHYTMLSIALESVNATSVLGAGIGAYLGTASGIERAAHIDDSAYYNIKLAPAILLPSSFVVACNIYSNATVPFKSAQENVWTFVTNLKNRTFPFNKAVAATFAITIGGLICQPFTAFYSSSRGIKKIPYIHASDDIANIGGGVFAAALLCYQLFTNVPAMYRKLNNSHSHYIIEQEKHRFDTLYRTLVLSVGILDTLITASNSYRSIKSTMNDSFHFDPNSVTILVLAILATISFAIPQYAFNVVEMTDKTRRHWYKYKKVPILKDEQVALLEKGIIPEELADDPRYDGFRHDDAIPSIVRTNSSSSIESTGSIDSTVEFAHLQRQEAGCLSNFFGIFRNNNGTRSEKFGLVKSDITRESLLLDSDSDGTSSDYIPSPN